MERDIPELIPRLEAAASLVETQRRYSEVRTTFGNGSPEEKAVSKEFYDLRDRLTPLEKVIGFEAINSKATSN